jgi:hypothetical protein
MKKFKKLDVKLGTVVALVDILVNFIHLPLEAVQCHTQAIGMDKYSTLHGTPGIKQERDQLEQTDVTHPALHPCKTKRKKLLLKSSR